MIGLLRGILVTKSPPFLLLDVHGVGYEIEAPMTTFYSLPATGEEISLHTHLVVREDAHILFGFATDSDRMMFRELIRINGVGPKLALTILSGQSAEEFRLVIQDSDIQALVRLPGVGKKTAERLIIEMRDRLPDISGSSVSAAQNALETAVPLALNTPRQEAVSALCALGYKPADAARMIRNVEADDKSLEEIIRLALQATVP